MSCDMNSGYVGWGMSKRACEAYSDGERPKSKWTKGDMLEALRSVAADMNVLLPTQLAKLRKKTLFAYLFTCSSWHHTSICCNETDFYSVDREAVESLTDEKVRRWLSEDSECVEAERKAPVADSEFVRIRFTEWVGQGRHKSPIEQLGWGVLAGDWCRLAEPSANGAQKKNVSSNACKVEARFDSERKMLDNKAAAMVSSFNGECISVDVCGKQIKAFVDDNWLYLVSEEGSVSRKKACARNKISNIERIRIGDLRKEGTPQSKALLELRDKRRSKMR